MTTTRREWLVGYLAISLFPTLARASDRVTTRFRVICAPSNLGLRPNANGAIPGTWRAPEVLLDAGIARALLKPSNRIYVRYKIVGDKRETIDIWRNDAPIGN